jgi:hypothetical protein
MTDTRSFRPDRRKALRMTAGSILAAGLSSPFGLGLTKAADLIGEIALEPGWYRSSSKSHKRHHWIGHYVLPEFRFERIPRSGKKRRVRLRKLRNSRKIIAVGHLFGPNTGVGDESDEPKIDKYKRVEKPSGRINGASGAKVERFRRLSHEDLPEFAGNPAPRLNLNHYSVGIEATALDLWTSGRREQAVEVLRVGLTYVLKDNADRPLNLRLLDLLSGLLWRSNRPVDLAKLVSKMQPNAEEIEATINSLQAALVNKSAKQKVRRPRSNEPWTAADVEVAKLQESIRMASARMRQIKIRLFNWSAGSGLWHRKWHPDAKRSWAGVDL